MVKWRAMGSQETKRRVVGLVIAGGKASRMGADKPFVRFQNGVLLDAVVDRVLPQVDALMLNVRPEHVAPCQSRYGDKFVLLPDAFDGNCGPLGGVIAGLQQLPPLNAEWLATFPCDTPFIPRDIVATLLETAQLTVGRPVVAAASGQVQNLCAVWPYQTLEALREGVKSGAFRSAWWALDALHAVRLDISGEPHAFFNINTPEDLADAEKLAGGSRERT